jgi:hypothetical protein
MNTKSHRTTPRPNQSNEAQEPRKRFRIEKLEERIAPSKGGKGTHNCGGGGSTSSGSFSGSIF